ncbi:hypothetical protein QD460_14985 [Rhizobium jaguaris]
MTFRVHDWPNFVEAPSQGSARIIRNFPEHPAKVVATLGSSDDGQITKKGTGLLRLWQGQQPSLLSDVEFAQYLDCQLVDHDAPT